MNDKIIIKGAKEHNLKNINLEIPRDKLVVVTGLSGSGKSSLAFDTLYAEGQRRYVESLSSYARQFLGLMEKPDVESIEGLSPAISIDQKTTSKNPRSTVGTVTEIYDYIRLLYARIGVPYCPICGKKIEKQTIDQIIDNIMKLEEGTKIQVIAPIIRGRKGEYTKLIQDLLKEGFIRARIDGENVELSDDIQIDRKKKHNIDLIVDRLVIKPDIRSRLTESVEIALKHADNIVTIDVPGKGETLYSQNYACPDCGFSFPELTPRMFSFNNPQGACPECTGIGYLMKMDEDLIIPDKNKTLYDGVKAFGSSTMKKGETMAKMYFEAIGKHYGVDIKVPIKKLPRDFLDKILYGTGDECIDFEHESPFGIRKFSAPFEGVIPTLERRHNETKSQGMREFYEMYMSESPCHACHGARLRKEILSIKVGDKNINELTDMPINKIRDYLKNLELTNQEKLIGEQIFKEIDKRLNFLIDVGLEYLTLSRSAGTLSGGESQRIRLATQIGSGLTGVLYILDEPSIGLHQRDNDKLLATLKKLRDLGNTLLVVEHDEDTMYAADQIIDIGPGAGVHGGNVMAQGTAEEIKKVENSITGQYLSGRKKIPVPKKRRKTIKGKAIEVKGATEHNLKNISVKFPLGVFNCVTGVSGSGKSTLVNEILYKTITKQLNGSNEKPGKCKEVVGIDKIDKIINIDQSPIGRTPRSNPATYTGVFDTIREIFANTNEAKLRGYQKGRFSFNVQGGRCEACNGDGLIKIEMHFLPDIYVPCEVCKGKRYNHETLEVKYKGKTIADVLDMTVEEALDFFSNIPKIKQKIQTLYDVGLGYIKLGQPSTTLSGGEAQRVKLATELSKRATGKTLYILDEPTTGLHIADVHRLVNILQRLVDTGNTIIVIEHNLDLIKTCDYIIDLGPEGGDGGGEIVAVGTPEQICKNDRSYTGKFLKKYLEE